MGKRKRRPKKYIPSPVFWIVVIGITTLMAFGIFFLFGHKGEKGEIAPKQKESLQKVAIIIDDIGYTISPVRELLKIDAPITFAILPQCTYSRTAARAAHQAGKEIILHLPMEPHGFPEKNPGVGALMTNMNSKEITSQLLANIVSVPYISGVNNHMGSKFMEDTQRLETVFRTMKEKNLFFIDSCTTSDSRTRTVADATGVRYAVRDIFIDNGKDYDETVNILKSLLRKRASWKTLIIIGHPYESTAHALKTMVPVYKKTGINIVPVSQLLF